MEIVSYNWGDESTNKVGICFRDGHDKIMVFCDESGYEIMGAGDCQVNTVFGSLPRDPRESSAVAHALGEALYSMLGGYR